jgi:hypothetical protein
VSKIINPVLLGETVNSASPLISAKSVLEVSLSNRSHFLNNANVSIFKAVSKNWGKVCLESQFDFIWNEKTYNTNAYHTNN